MVIFDASCWTLIRNNHGVCKSISCIFPTPFFWAKVYFWMLCDKFGKRIIMGIMLTPLESRSIINYLTVWQINNLYTDRIVGFSIIKRVLMIGWFLAKGNKSVIYHTKPIAPFQNLNLVLYPFFCGFFFILSRPSNVNGTKIATCNSCYYMLYNKINYALSHSTK